MAKVSDAGKNASIFEHRWTSAVKEIPLPEGEIPDGEGRRDKARILSQRMDPPTGYDPIGFRLDEKYEPYHS